jgi:hypothetical protein
MGITITRLPPGNAHGSESQPQFHDSKARKSIHTTRRHDGTFETTGLDVSDIYQADGGARMHVERRSVGFSGRSNPPEWAINGELTRQVICEYLISRVKQGRRAHRKTAKTTSERFNEACEISKKNVPAQKARLAALCEEFHCMSVARAPEERLRSLQL